MYGVKLSDDGINELAASRNADVVLYGHTHVAKEDYRSILGKGVYFFNPGALKNDYGTKSSYGILDINEKTLLLSHGTI